MGTEVAASSAPAASKAATTTCVSQAMELNNHLPPKPLTFKSVPTLWQIANEVARKRNLTISLLRCRKRTGPITAARFEYCYRAASETSCTYAQIGRVVLIDRTSVAYAVIRCAILFDLPLPPGCNWHTVAARARAVRSKKPMDTRPPPLDTQKNQRKPLWS